MKNYTQKITLEVNAQDRDVYITSKEATQPFKLHELDIEFIQQDIDDSGAMNGELEVDVEEGIITVQWQVMEWGAE